MSDSAENLFSEFWAWRLRRSPEFATMVGSKQFNSVLEEFTEKRFQEDYQTCLEFTRRAEIILGEPGNDDTVKNNLEFFVAEVATFLTGYHLKGFFLPMNYMEGVHVDFQRLPEWASPSCLEDFRDLVARYNLLPDYVEQVVGMMRCGVKEGLTNHAVSMKGVVEQCKAHLVGNVEKSVFFEPFLTLDKMDSSAEEKEKVKKDAAEAIEKCVRPAYSSLAAFVETEYLPACRKEIAASSLPGGKEFYAGCLKFHTSTDLGPEEIHRMGLEEVDRIEKEMKEILVKLGLDLSLKEFIEKCRADKGNFFTSGQELMDSFRTIIEDRINPKITSIFHEKPKGRLEITEAPMAEYPAAFYIAGTADGTRPGKLFANTFKHSSQPRYEMVSLSLHEVSPGHHLQGCYIQQDTWPEFRKVMEDKAYSIAPSRFPINTAYVEGWGLYSETLGFDMELYNDPMDRYGHLSEEIFRACRLVVDPGMHALGWSQEQAVTYMLEHSAASRENIEGEVNRYVTWPGQATGYKIGQMKILELRRKTEQALADKFDIKEFHEVVLKAAGPLNILERKVDEFIAKYV